jgi:hypothetical protein
LPALIPRQHFAVAHPQARPHADHDDHRLDRDRITIVVMIDCWSALLVLNRTG